jgi:hypothetical protein
MFGLTLTSCSHNPQRANLELHMCLGPDFFDAREEQLRSSEARGELELSAFLKARRISFHRVMMAGLLQMRETVSTADLDPFFPSRLGRTFLREDKNCQIIFVRKSRQAAFLLAIRAT